MKTFASSYISSILPSSLVFGLLCLLFVGPTSMADSPDEGVFETYNPCGYVDGEAFISGAVDVYDGNRQVIFSDVENQGCVDKNGYFYNQFWGHSKAMLSILTGDDADKEIFMDFNWATNPADYPFVDFYGDDDGMFAQWDGFALLDDETIPEGERWVQFDWELDCAPGDVLCEIFDELVEDDLRVKTALQDDPEGYFSKGDVMGMAWNDHYGWLDFGGLTQELPPKQIEVFVDVESAEGLSPSGVNTATAPLADAYDYWRVKAHFYDRITGEPIAGDVLDSISFDFNLSGALPLNQIDPSGISGGTGYDAGAAGRAVIVESDHPSVSECAGTPEDEPCRIEEDDGSVTYNYFISSGAPTSNMVGHLNDAGTILKYPTSRDGCLDFYNSPLMETMEHDIGRSPYPPFDDMTCPASGDLKGGQFFERGKDWHRLILDDIEIEFEINEDFALEQDYFLYHQGEEYYGYDGVYEFTFHNPDLNKNLSYRPIAQIDRFELVYADGSGGHTVFPGTEEDMYLDWELDIAPFSQAYNDGGGYYIKTGPSIVNWADHPQNSANLDAGNFNAIYLLLESICDITDDFIGVCPLDVSRLGLSRSMHSVTVYTEGGTSDSGYEKLFYEQQIPGGPVADMVEYNGTPTVEQMICQNVDASRFDLGVLGFGDEVCYYTGYLPRADRYLEAESMKLIGAVNASNLAREFFEGAGDDVSVLGNTDTFLLRNKMFSQIARYTVGVDAAGGTLDSAMEPTHGSDIAELLGGRLLYAEGDVNLTGDDGIAYGLYPTDFGDKTLVVVGGNVYIENDIAGGQLGLIVLKDSEGNGGNVYVGPKPTDLFVNFFLDGTLYSYNGDEKPSGRPVWSGSSRVDILKNQLYIRGSLISKNTIGGASGDAPWYKGDGTEALVQGIARQDDLNEMRVFRRCYSESLGIGGLISEEDEVVRLCDEGEVLSNWYRPDKYDGERAADLTDREGYVDLIDYNPLIIEYYPAKGLPVFDSNIDF
ncbi:hypothetical protein HOC00_02160 [Candidatus Peregrinibacteria bacterium]|jgi:hypothetical protein|nr:hypothetical protein [Candidatus Peregrinibacteria bacterium]MBT5517244.1 hypothetical protein [Candidatus Peregrinibacteria bacterium]